jgi:hypothetical protein
MGGAVPGRPGCHALLVSRVGAHVVAALGGQRRAVDGDRPRRRPARGAGTAGPRAARALPRADGARPPAGQLLERARAPGRSRGSQRRRGGRRARALGRMARAAPRRAPARLTAGGGPARRGAPRAGAAADSLPRHGAARHFRGVPPVASAQAPQGPAQAHAQARRRPARAARRDGPGGAAHSDRPLAEDQGALVGEPRQGHGPRAREHPLP